MIAPLGAVNHDFEALSTDEGRDDDQAPNGERNLATVSAGEAAVVGRRVLE